MIGAVGSAPQPLGSSRAEDARSLQPLLALLDAAARREDVVELLGPSPAAALLDGLADKARTIADLSLQAAAPTAPMVVQATAARLPQAVANALADHIYSAATEPLPPSLDASVRVLAAGSSLVAAYLERAARYLLVSRLVASGREDLDALVAALKRAAANAESISGRRGGHDEPPAGNRERGDGDDAPRTAQEAAPPHGDSRESGDGGATEESEDAEHPTDAPSTANEGGEDPAHAPAAADTARSESRVFAEAISPSAADERPVPSPEGLAHVALGARRPAEIDEPHAVDGSASVGERNADSDAASDVHSSLSADAIGEPGPSQEIGAPAPLRLIPATSGRSPAPDNRSSAEIRSAAAPSDSPDEDGPANGDARDPSAGSGTETPSRQEGADAPVPVRPSWRALPRLVAGGYHIVPVAVALEQLRDGAEWIVAPPFPAGADDVLGPAAAGLSLADRVSLRTLGERTARSTPALTRAVALLRVPPSWGEELLDALAPPVGREPTERARRQIRVLTTLTQWREDVAPSAARGGGSTPADMRAANRRRGGGGEPFTRAQIAIALAELVERPLPPDVRSLLDAAPMDPADRATLGRAVRYVQATREVDEWTKTAALGTAQERAWTPDDLLGEALPSVGLLDRALLRELARSPLALPATEGATAARRVRGSARSSSSERAAAWALRGTEAVGQALTSRPEPVSDGRPPRTTPASDERHRRERWPELTAIAVVILLWLLFG